MPMKLLRSLTLAALVPATLVALSVETFAGTLVL